MTKKFSLKPEIEKLDIEVDGEPVYVKQLSGGDAVQLAEMQGEMAALASKVRTKTGSDDPEEVEEVAAQELTPSQFKTFSLYQFDLVFVRWCNQDGTPRFTDREAFDSVPSELIKAIYSACTELDITGNEAEGNS